MRNPDGSDVPLLTVVQRVAVREYPHAVVMELATFGRDVGYARMNNGRTIFVRQDGSIVLGNPQR